MNDWPFLTGDLPGIGGTIKQQVEDFVVREEPLYEPSGQGSHVYFRVVKRGISTPQAVSRIARSLQVKPGQIGYAGLKDAFGVTEQTMSVEHVDPERLKSIRDPNLQIVGISRHTNKLRLGHLRANGFRIRIRQVGADDLPRAGQILEVLKRRGAANYFGPQRFGMRGDTGHLGKALLRGDLDGFLDLLLGRPGPADPPEVRAARDAFQAGRLDRALQRWPRKYDAPRRALIALKKKGKASAAVAAIDKRMKRLYVSAFQSLVFNDILAGRIETLDRLLPGDLARKTDTGGVFEVQDPSGEQSRCDRFEISPTGLLPGSKAPIATGQAGRIERDVLDAHGIDAEGFAKVGSLKVKGTRRCLRFALENPSIQAGQDENGSYIELCFSAPSGCYATAVLAEIMKPPPSNA
jgi:tRNA pseudouridine13 synthase